MNYDYTQKVNKSPMYFSLNEKFCRFCIFCNEYVYVNVINNNNNTNCICKLYKV